MNNYIQYEILMEPLIHDSTELIYFDKEAHEEQVDQLWLCFRIIFINRSQGHVTALIAYILRCGHQRLAQHYLANTLYKGAWQIQNIQKSTLSLLL